MKVSGRYMGYLKRKNKILNIIYKIFGHLDLHTQIRTRPIVKLIDKKKEMFQDKVILEIGCGSGNNCFEIIIANPKIVIGVDLNEESIQLADNISKELGYTDKINFICDNAENIDFSKIGKVDILLLIDFLEHIETPSKFLSSIYDILNDDCIILVSVPTYKYKKVFGEKFHNLVGHVKDGYDLNEIRILFNEEKFEVIECSYNTGLFGAIGCFIFYRLMSKNKYLNLLKSLLLYPFSLLDFINNKYISCSMFLIIKKRIYKNV